MTDTIFANVTPMVTTAVAIVRISGPYASDALVKLTGKPLPEPRKAVYCTLLHPTEGDVLDKALVYWFKGPHSFTGEDTVELHLHGSRAVVLRCLDALASFEGLRFAEPGEFSKRAFDNGKMDLTQAEGLADLISSDTAQQAKQAMRQMCGQLGKLYDGWREQIIALMAHMEAYIDFPDEDIPNSVVQSIVSKQEDLLKSFEEHLQDGCKGELLKKGIHVAIIGEPNAGKSTLINNLSGRDVAIVSQQAGTTRDVIEVSLDIEGYPFILADTAGIRRTDQEIEEEGIARAIQRAKQADIVIVMIDATQPDVDDAINQWLSQPNVMVVYNKIDYKNVNIPAPATTDARNIGAVMISAVTGQGIDELLAMMLKFAKYHVGQNDDPMITRQRHRLLVQEAHDQLAELDLSQPPEIAAQYLRNTANALGKLTGKIDLEEVLDSLFSEFCIGK